MLEDLLVEALERAERDGPEGLEAWLDEHPEHASRVRLHVDRIQRLGLASDERVRAHPERLGDFRILAPLGQGAMGAVYRAVQESLGREVALKLIRPEQLLFAGARERFQREVALVARLQHPGIVPVHAVGSEAGVPLFAMELVHGATLHDVIAELQGRDLHSLDGRDFDRTIARRLGEGESSSPSEFFEGSWTTVALRILREAAEALEHAHRRGVLHRDVKPSNLMLTREGRVLLVDFGLAGALGGERLTRAGSQVGSLAYMAPELLAGEARELDSRCDVYALGVTAYELLTLRLPYASSDPLVLRRLAGAAERPKLAERNLEVSWELETVVATALEPDPARRYATAALFARDLDNVLSRRPIEARAASAPLRLRRWVQRRPALATAIALGVLLCAAGPLGWELNRMRTLDEVRAAAERADRDFHTALATIGRVLRDTAFDELEDVPGAQRARLTAIDRALALYDELARERRDDVEVLFEGGELHQARGTVLRDLGRTEEALTESRAAVDYHRRVLALEPTPPHRSFLAGALSAVGKALAALERAEESLPLYAEALSLQREVVAADSAASGPRLRLARLLLYVVEARRLLEQDAGDAELDEALALAREVRTAAPHDAEAAWTVGRAEDERAWLEKTRGRAAAALEHARLARAAYVEAHELAPDSRFYAFDAATGERVVAGRALDVGGYEEADRALATASEIVAGLLRDFPDSTRYRNFEVEILTTRGVSLGRQQRHAEARAVLLRCAESYEHLLRQEPGSCALALRCAEALGNVAISRILGHVELDLALADIARARDLLAACDGSSGDRGALAAQIDRLEYHEGLALCFLDRPDDALGVITARSTELETDPMSLRMSADLWNEYVLCLRRSAPAGPAREALERDARGRMLYELGRAISAGYADREELATTQSLDPFRDEPEFRALLERLDSR